MRKGRTLARAAALGCAATLLCLVPASTASAGFKSGTYTGTTSDQTRISFRATQVLVKRFSYVVMVDCEDGRHESRWGAAADKRSATAPLNARGRFTAEFVSEDGLITSVVRGRLKHRKASGKIETAGTVPGSGECSSSVDWIARKQKPAAG